MSAIDALLGRQFAEALGWALLHSVWQVALVGAVAGLALAALRKGGADVRYVVSSIALALMLTLPVVTFCTTYGARVEAERAVGPAARVSEEPAAAVADVRGDAPPPAHASRAAAPSSAGWQVRGWLPIFAACWLAGVTLLSLRLLSGWMLVQRLRVRRRRPLSVPVRGAIDRLSRRLHVGGAIAAFESAAVDVPTVIGWIKPVLLLPASALAGLSPAQLEAILAHELAHVRRHDYLVNILQAVVETLVFYHPVVWWISRRIRIEREHCCDDLAVTLCGDPVRYARALAELEALRGGRQVLALAATDGSLVGRIRRLRGATAPHDDRSPAWLAAVSAMTLVVLTAVGVNALDAPRAGGPPVANAGPVALAPRLRVAAFDTHVQSNGESRIVHSDGLQRFEVRYRGRIELTDDDGDIKSISPDGYLIVSDGKWFWFKDYRIDIRPGPNGTLERRFWVDGRERPYEPEGREWLEKSLIRLIRTSGFAADSRIARIMAASGPAGVLDEIGELEGDYVRRIYFEKLLESATLDPAMLQRALALAGHDISSDYELSRVLRKAGDTQKLDDDASRAAYFDATVHLSSDYELQRTLAALLDHGSLDDALVTRLLGAAAHLDSDYEASRLLRKVVDRHPLSGASRAAFFTAIDTIGSDYERQRVLAAVMARPGLDPAVAAMALQSALGFGSDFERSRLLMAVASKQSIDGPLRVDFFKAVDGISSAYERRRVLTPVAETPDLSEDTLVALLDAASKIGSDFDLANVLVTVARNQKVEGRVREAFLAASDRISSDYESGRVMTALVRSERK